MTSLHNSFDSELTLRSRRTDHLLEDLDNSDIYKDALERSLSTKRKMKKSLENSPQKIIYTRKIKEIQTKYGKAIKPIHEQEVESSHNFAERSSKNNPFKNSRREKMAQQEYGMFYSRTSSYQNQENEKGLVNRRTGSMANTLNKKIEFSEIYVDKNGHHNQYNQQYSQQNIGTSRSSSNSKRNFQKNKKTMMMNSSNQIKGLSQTQKWTDSTKQFLRELNQSRFLKKPSKGVSSINLEKGEPNEDYKPKGWNNLRQQAQGAIPSSQKNTTIRKEKLRQMKKICPQKELSLQHSYIPIYGDKQSTSKSRKRVNHSKNKNQTRGRKVHMRRGSCSFASTHLYKSSISSIHSKDSTSRKISRKQSSLLTRIAKGAHKTRGKEGKLYRRSLSKKRKSSSGLTSTSSKLKSVILVSHHKNTKKVGGQVKGIENRRSSCNDTRNYFPYQEVESGTNNSGDNFKRTSLSNYLYGPSSTQKQLTQSQSNNANVINSSFVNIDTGNESFEEDFEDTLFYQSETHNNQVEEVEKREQKQQQNALDEYIYNKKQDGSQREEPELDEDRDTLKSLVDFQSKVIDFLMLNSPSISQISCLENVDPEVVNYLKELETLKRD